MFQECFSGSLESQVINNVKFFQSLNIIEGDILQLDNDTNAKDTVDEDFLLLIIESGTQKSYEVSFWDFGTSTRIKKRHSNFKNH